MDRYFASSYDPRLDFTLDDVTDSSTGLVVGGAGAFDSWDRMLDMVKARKEDKKEREAREKAERKAERERVRRERDERRRKRRKGSASSEASSDEDVVGPRYDAKTGLMEMNYGRKGKTREWDLGKEQPT